MGDKHQSKTDCGKDCVEFKSMYVLLGSSCYVDARRKEDLLERIERQSRIDTLIQIPVPTKEPKRQDFLTKDEYIDACEDYTTLIGLDGEVHLYPAWLVNMIVLKNNQAIAFGGAPLLERDKRTGWCRILQAALMALAPFMDFPYYSAEKDWVASSGPEYPLVRDALGYGFDVFVFYCRGVGHSIRAGSWCAYQSLIYQQGLRDVKQIPRVVPNDSFPVGSPRTLARNMGWVFRQAIAEGIIALSIGGETR